MEKRNTGYGNPYTRARLSVGMSTPDLSRASDLSFSVIWNVEQGLVAHPNPRIKETLAAVGIDIRNLDAEYQAWRKSEARATIQKFAAAAGARG